MSEKYIIGTFVVVAFLVTQFFTFLLVIHNSQHKMFKSPIICTFTIYTLNSPFLKRMKVKCTKTNFKLRTELSKVHVIKIWLFNYPNVDWKIIFTKNVYLSCQHFYRIYYNHFVTFSIWKNPLRCTCKIKYIPLERLFMNNNLINE